MAGTGEMVASGRCADLAPSRRRVLLVAPYAPRGGGMGRIMAYLSSQGDQAGVEFEMVESRGGGSAASSVRYAFYAAVRILSSGFLRSDTIVHLSFGDYGSIARKGTLLLLARALGLKTVLHLHAADIVGVYEGLPSWRQILMAWLFRRAGICVVLGPVWQDWLVATLRVTPDRVAVVRNGVPQPLIEPLMRTDGTYSLIFLGNLLPRKGVPDLLHALASIHSDPLRPQRTWRLILAGGGDAGKLRALAKELGIADAMRFVGWVDRGAASRLLGQADVLVLPSYHEALPLVLLEAASLGVPVVATRVGAVPEIFTDGRDALLVPAGDRGALADAISRLMNDPDLARRIGDNARSLYESQFGMRNFVQGMSEVYARVAGAPG